MNSVVPNCLRRRPAVALALPIAPFAAVERAQAACAPTSPVDNATGPYTTELGTDPSAGWRGREAGGGAAAVSRMGARTMRWHQWRLRTRHAALLSGVSIGVAALLAPGAATAQQGPFLYVPNSSGNINSVSVIDTSTDTALPAAIPVGNAPIAVAVRGDQSFAYVTNNGANTVSVVNTAANTVVATIAVGSGPALAAVSPDGSRVYVSNFNDGTVSVVDTATNTVLTTFAVGTGPRGVAFNPDGTRAYVANLGGTVSVIDTATNSVLTTVGVGNQPLGVAVSPDGSRAYVANRVGNTVSVIDTATNTVLTTVTVGSNPSGIAVSPNGSRAYVANQGGTVSVIDTATNAVVATVVVGNGATGIAFSPDGGRVYVTNISDGTVSVVDTATNTVIGTVTVGTQPFIPGICSNGNALLASGRTFTARTSGALACTLASGPTGSPGPVFTGGTLQIAGTNIVSALPILLQSQGGTIDTNGNSATLSGTISGPGGLTKIGVGTLTLDGINSYGGNTNVNGGTLLVNGSIAASALTTVNPGGTLGGNGTVGNTIINGGTLSPGTSIGTLTVSGSLVMTAASTYLVEVSPTNADRTNVTGTATLGGTVQAVFAPGSYVTRTYTILTSASLGGSTFGGLTTSNLPAGFNASLSYTTTDAILNLTAGLGVGGALNQNQHNVANGINSFFNNGGALPLNFVGVFGLTGGNLANALTLLSGEAATGAQQGAFQLMGQFLGIMLDPFVDGRGGAGGGNGGATAFAPERAEMPDDVALAYAKVMKAPVTKARSFEQRWTAWGGPYGGYNRTAGDPSVVGSHDLTARAAGFAAGLDYQVARDTVAGVALAGGGADWSLAQGLGGGKSDAIQAGAYAATRAGPAYLAASLAVANHWMSTDRTAFAADHLTASFNAWSLGGRIEGGYRFATALGGVTPYAAGQAQSFRTPGYSETDVNGGGFALSYDARTATAVRSELGARFDHVAAVAPEAVLTLRGRLAWAHDWTSDPTRAAVFQALPGASFIVNGAAPAKDSALVSAGSELRLANGVSLSGKLDGEFAQRSSTYAGTGTVRVSW